MNVFELVPELERLKARLLGFGLKDEEPGGFDKRDRALVLEQLPYALAAAYASLHELRTRAEAVVGASIAGKAEGLVVLMLDPNKRNFIGYAIDNYLGSMRRAQNALLYYLSAALEKRDIASSMADVAEQILKGRALFTPEIDELISAYWQRSGEQIKQYRDLSEHFAVAASDARVFPTPTGQGLLHLLLPNNPDVKSARLLRYSEPPIHVLPFAVLSFADFLGFLSIVIRRLVEVAGSSDFSVTSIHPRGGLRVGGPHGGQPIPNSEEIDGAIRKFVLKQ